MNDELDPEIFGDLPPPEAQGPPSAQEEVQPQYPVVQSLGSGSYGVTNLCFDPYREGGQVVQKLMSERVSQQFPDLVEHHFSRLQGLAHPGLALVRDFGWEGGRAFLVREWVQGNSLAQEIAKLKFEEILGIFRQLLQVLDYLFSRNIFHLHLKPENLMVSSGGSNLLKVTDFGLSEGIHRVIPGKELRIGTPPYTAPDYSTHPVPDIRADLYSVGVLCYWAFSRQLPYPGRDAKKILQAQQMAEPKPVGQIVNVPEKLSQWVQSLIQPAAKDRPNDVRAVYRDFLTATESLNLKGANFPPLVFSAPDQVFRRKWALKTLRRMLQQGRRWAFQGSAGMGKSYFAHWVQRLLWSNQKRAVLYDGRVLAQIKGEVFEHAEGVAFVIIDNADGGPILPWLEARTYPHVIALGKDLSWAKNNPDWQFLNLELLDEAGLREILQETFGKISESNLQIFKTNVQGQPGELVYQTRALNRLGAVQPSGNQWILSEDALQRVSAGAPGGGISPLLKMLDVELRPVVTLLTLVQAPLTVTTVAEWLGREEAALRPILLDGAFQEILARRVWWGQEYFQSQMSAPKDTPEDVTEEDLQAWVLGLEELGWYNQGRQLLERGFPQDQVQRNSELILTRCRLAALSGDYGIVLQNMTASFVGQLSPEQQAQAFELLARALVASGKGGQAESAYKKAFAQYRSQQDIAGQAQVVLELAEWYGSTGNNERSLKFFEQALVLAKKLPTESSVLGQVFLGIGNFYAGQTDFARAEENFLKCVEPFIQHRQFRLLAKAYLAFANLWVEQGEFTQGEFYAREALFIANFMEDREVLAGVYFTLSQIEEHKTNAAAALERLGEVLFVLDQQTNKPLYGEALIRRAHFFEKNRMLDRALQEAGKILVLGNETQNELIKAQGYMIRGKVTRRDHKRLEEAFTQFRMAQDFLSKMPDASFGWECDYEMGEIERNRGNSPKARTYYESALNRLNRYVNSLPKQVQEQFLQDGKREQIEMALKWLR